MGTYLIWDGERWVRSGKAVDIRARYIQHDKDKDTKAELFYQTWRDRWEQLRFCESLAFAEEQCDVAAHLLSYSAAVTKELRKKNGLGWVKRKASCTLHTIDVAKRHLLIYLIEKVDELLGDKNAFVSSSESIGFEGPLWSKLGRNYKDQ